MFSGSCSQCPGFVEITGPVDHYSCTPGCRESRCGCAVGCCQTNTLPAPDDVKIYVGRIGGKQGFYEIAGGVLLQRMLRAHAGQRIGSAPLRGSIGDSGPLCYGRISRPIPCRARYSNYTFIDRALFTYCLLVGIIFINIQLVKPEWRNFSITWGNT